MKNTGLVVGALALALSACSEAQTKADGGPSVAPLARVTVPVNVTIIDGAIIDVPPITYTFKQHTAVEWTIQNEASENYTFPASGGIVFATPAGANFFRCTVSLPDKTTATCKKQHAHVSGVAFKYTVIIEKNSQPFGKLDPFINNR